MFVTIATGSGSPKVVLRASSKASQSVANSGRSYTIFEFEGGFVPPLGGTLEPRSGVGDLDSVFAEIVRVAPEDQLALR